MKNIIIWLMVFCMSANASASVAIRGLGSSEEQFAGFIANQKAKLKSFTADHIEGKTDELKSQKITGLFEDGLKYFFAGSKKMASESFLEIISYAYDSDWRVNQTDMIVQSYIKLATLNPNKETEYLKQAINFQYEYAPASEKWKSVRDKIKILHWQMTPFKKFDYVIVNSKPYNLKSTDEILLPIAEHRITFVSNLYRPQTFRMHTDQLAVMAAPTIPFLDGDCENPGPAPDGDVIAFFNSNCIKENNGARWVNYNEHTPPDLNPETPSQSFTNFGDGPKPLSKKAWFWAAIGVIAGTIIWVATKKKASVGPSTETVDVE